MAFHYITGGLGAGKTKLTVLKIQEALNKGLKVATNIDLKLEQMLPDSNKTAQVIRLPDKPTIDDLNAIGFGYDHENPEHYDENQFGILALDELGTWFNSREWNDKGRRPLINWLLHARKRRWHMFFLIQDLELLDNQAKAATAKQFIVECRDLSNYAVPIISPIFKLFTGRDFLLTWLPFVNKNMGIVRVGMGQKASVRTRWTYNNPHIHNAYNTLQEFLEPDSPDACGLYQYLPPWHYKGRYKVVKDFKYYKNLVADNAIYLLFPVFFMTVFSILALFFSVRSAVLASEANDRVVYVVENYEKPVIAPSLPVSLESEQEIDPSVDCDVFESRINEFKITGSFNSDEKTPDVLSYLFVDKNGSYPSDYFINLGFQQESINKCRVNFSFEGCKATLTCSFKPALPSDPLVEDGKAGSDSAKEGNKKKSSGFLTSTFF